jgi:uncharacterized protein YdaU (DUF1376 family)
MSSTPFMPLWVSDFLGDTLDLDATEIGAYMLLLMAQWNRDGESLPADDKKLQRVARCGRNWPKVWGNIERFFKADEQGVYSKRLRLEAQNVAAKREVNKHNGGRGGKAKALKTNNVDLANATNPLERNPTIPEPEPEPIKRDTSVSTKKAPAKRSVAIHPDWVPSDKNIEDAEAQQFSAKEIHNEADKFRDYHLAKGTTFKDWDAGWRTWLGNARKFAAGRGVAGVSQGGGYGRGGGIAGEVARRRLAGEN